MIEQYFTSGQKKYVQVAPRVKLYFSFDHKFKTVNITCFIPLLNRYKPLESIT